LSVIWATKSPIMNVVLAPVKWCSTLVLTPLIGFTGSEGWLQLGSLLGLSLASGLLLLSRKENIYEPSLGISVKLARRRAAARSGDYSLMREEAMREKGLRQIWGGTLPPFGLGATAFVWKNLLIRFRTSRSYIFLGAFLALALIYSIRVFAPDKKNLEWLPIMFMYAAMGMSMAAQIDMRAELRQANIVKGMPIVAWKIVMAQVASSVASMTLAMWGLGACLWLFAPVVRGPIFCACALGLPFLAFAVAPAAMIPAILYPEMRDMLQNYLSGMLAVLFVGMAVAPPAAVGNALEVAEAIETLQGNGPEDLRNLCIELSSLMLQTAGRCAKREQAVALADSVLDSGAALDMFRKIVAAQGGDARVTDDPAVLPKATHVQEIVSGSSGHVESIDCAGIDRAASLLGAGRERKEDSIDPAVGIIVHKKLGSAVKKGEAIATPPPLVHETL